MLICLNLSGWHCKFDLSIREYMWLKLLKKNQFHSMAVNLSATAETLFSKLSFAIAYFDNFKLFTHALQVSRIVWLLPVDKHNG